jgi:hypothetical protein
MEEINPLALKEEWQQMIQYGYNIRKNNLNGLDEWQPIKKKLEKRNGNIPLKTFIRDTFSQSYEDNPDVKMTVGQTVLNFSVESEHFFIQHVRIILMSGVEISILKLLQIAYNAGQFKAMRENNMYNQEVLECYDRNNLDQIETYVMLPRQVYCRWG